MRARYYVISAALITAIATVAQPLMAANISSSDIMVYQTRNDVTGTANAAPVTILEINPTSHALVQSFPISTQASPLYSTIVDPLANLSLSAGGNLLSFSGWTNRGTTGALGTNFSIPRGVGTLSAAGTYSQPTTYLTGPQTTGGPDQPHAAYSPDGVNWLMGATTGIYYNGGTAPLTSTDATLSVKNFGSNTYALHTLDSNFLPPVGNDIGPGSIATALSRITPNPAPGITSITNSPVITLPAEAHDFVLLSSFNQAPDLLYVTTATGITKFAFPGGFIGTGSWINEGTFALAGATSITGKFVPGTGTELFVTVNNGPPPAVVSTLDELIDSATTPGPISTTGPSVIFTAGALNSLQGVSLAPTPEPASIAALGIGSIALACRRRKNY